MKEALFAAALTVVIWSGAASQERPAPPSTPAPNAPALHPDTVFRIPTGPRVIILDAPESPVVSLRLVLPVTEGPVEAGSAAVLQHVRLKALRSLARQVGARVEGSRTHRGLVYSVSGTVPDFDYLAWLAREAVAEPRPNRADVEEAVQVVRAHSERSAETAEGRLRERLRRAVWPSQAPPEGTYASLERINRASLRDFWARTHQAERMTLVVVGPVEPVLVLAAFQGIGAPPERAGGPLDAPSPSGGRSPELQILRTWYGEAFVVADGSDPRPAVAAALMADRLEEAPIRLEGTVELWEAGSVSALITLGAAYREDVNAMRRTIRELPGSTARALDAGRLERTVGQVRADLLLGARTPWELASLVGHFAQETGDPQGAERFLDALRSLELEEMRAFLDELQTGAPVREELRP